VKDHELCEHSCGPGSPFEKLTELDAKAVFFNVPFANFTYFHYLEHLVHLQLPFALYTEEPIVVSVIDRDGQRKEVSTYAFAPEAISRRRFETFEREMLARDMIHEQRIGNTYVLVVRLRDAVECVREMSVNGIYFYDLEVPGVVGTTGAT
jgi:aminoglycoside N3'-acetyltransferase